MSTYYVNALAAAGGNGLSEGAAFNNFNDLMAVIGPSDDVVVAGGVYEESFTIPPSASGSTSATPTRIIGDPNDPFVLSGGTAMPGLSACTIADEPVVGANWAQMFKTTLDNASLSGSDPWTANISEDGLQLQIAVERGAIPAGTPQEKYDFFNTNPTYYHIADSVVLSGANIIGYKKPSVTGAYTKAQLDNSQINIVRDPNFAGKSGVNYNATTETLMLTTTNYVYENSDLKDSFALFNLIPAMTQGQWGFVNNGTTSTFYVWPNDSANIAAGKVQYSARDRIVTMHAVSNFEMAYFTVRQSSSTSKQYEPIVSINLGAHPANVRLHHFTISDCYSTDGYGGVYFAGVDDYEIDHFVVRKCLGMTGVFVNSFGAGDADWPRLAFTGGVSVADGVTLTGAISGATINTLFQNGTGSSFFCYEPGGITGTFQDNENLLLGGSTVGQVDLPASDLTNKGDASLVNHALRGHIHHGEIDRVSKGPIYAYTQRDLAIHHIRSKLCGFSAHANTVTFYQGNHNLLCMNFDGFDADGYGTHQESNAFIYANVRFSASLGPSGGARAYAQQQNRYSELPGVVHGWLPSGMFGATLTPNPANYASFGNSISLSHANAPLDMWSAYNLIIHGSDAESGAALTDWDYCINTSTVGPATRGANDIQVLITDLYTDPANGDFSIKAGAATETFTTRSLASEVAAWKVRWPQVEAVDWDTDMFGDTIDWANPPIGHAVNLNGQWVDGWVGLGAADGVVTYPTITGDVLRITLQVLGDVPSGELLETAVIGIMGQSQLEYILNPSGTYGQIPDPTNLPINPNMTVWTSTSLAPTPLKTVVTSAAVANGNVNPVLASWSVLFNAIAPGTYFHIVDFAVPGTSRASLQQTDHPDARWPGFMDMINAVRADGLEFDAILENWQVDDAGTGKDFGQEWAPFYFGQRWGGEAFTLGVPNPDSSSNPTSDVDNILWDIEAASNVPGRGVFTRDRTKFWISGWPTFGGAATSPTAEHINSSTEWDGTPVSGIMYQLDDPARKLIIDFLADSRVATFAGEAVGSGHIGFMNGSVHPETNPANLETPADGQVFSGIGLAAASLAIAGVPITDPLITGVTLGPAGAYADVTVSLPNGGDLTTIRALEGRAGPAVEPPHYQPVMGFEIRRVGDADDERRPVFKSSETSYPAAYRGSVTIQDAGTGTGAGRTGTIRITPDVAFAAGDMLTFDRGDASMQLLRPRDVDANMYLDQPIETVSAWRNVADTYPFPGILVRPQPPTLVM